MRNREVGTKHVFAGGTRLVSKLVKAPNVVDLDGDGIPDDIANACSEPWGWTNGNGGQGNGNGLCNGNGGAGQGNGNGNSSPEVFEKDQYYYHPDHLGSSSYVTDLDGEIFQHLEYFPFGETWVEESSNTQRTPYLFTAKELDEETGLYYFGARYYDPRTSVWQSPDPKLPEYMGTEEFDNPVDLSLYAYSHMRPLVMSDPDGRDAMIVVFPDYKINVGGAQVPFLGHAGVVIINNETGATRYFEYGRYDSENRGIVRSRPVPNLVMQDGKPTPESMKRLMRSLSEGPGKGSSVVADYDGTATDFSAMLTYAEDRMAQNNDPDREEYGICYNNCFSFAEDTASAGRTGIGGFLRNLNEGTDVTPDMPTAKSGSDVIYDPESDTLGGWMYFFEPFKSDE